jgi:hypothetical protein
MENINKQLVAMGINDLNLVKNLIDTLIKNKIKNELQIGTKVFVVQKTKKTEGILTKIMNSKCLVNLQGRIYTVPMTMIERA